MSGWRMRRVLSVLLICACVVLVLASTAVAAVFGPDDKATTREDDVATHGAGLVTVPSAIPYAGPRVDITAQARDQGRQLFAGVAHDVDVRDFVGGVARTEVTSIGFPLHLSTKDLGGSLDLPADPAALDIWITHVEGVGKVELSFRLPETADDVVILSTDGRPIGRLTVAASLVLPGVFAGALAGVVVGLGLGLAGWTLAGVRRVPVGDVPDDAGQHP
jgi:hypothetical protein